MARLRENFGEAAFKPGREDLIGKAVRSLSDQSFEKIVSHFIANFRQAPLPKDFFEAAAKERIYTSTRSIPPPKPIDCHWCNDGGVIEVLHKETQKEYFMRCDCLEGAGSPCGRVKGSFRTEVPVWSKEYEREYVRFKFFGERALKWKPKRGFDPNDPQGSLKELVEIWSLKMRLSSIHFNGDPNDAA
jgi:hypothetical protein